MSMRNRLERKSSGDKVVEEVESVDSDADTAESDEKEGGKDKGSTGGQWDARPRMKGDACCSPSDGKKKKAKKSEGYNWSAMAILILFLAVPILTGLTFLYDYMNPKAAAERAVAHNVFRCYNAVGDTEKLDKIDHIVKKYKGRERALYTQLRNKYGEEYPECDNFVKQ